VRGLRPFLVREPLFGGPRTVRESRERIAIDVIHGERATDPDEIRRSTRGVGSSSPSAVGTAPDVDAARSPRRLQQSWSQWVTRIRALPGDTGKAPAWFGAAPSGSVSLVCPVVAYQFAVEDVAGGD